MKKQRKHYTPEEKVTILRRHLLEGVPISDVCDESGLQTTVFYRWQKEFWNGKPSKKGTGFEQPPQPHQHWHIATCAASWTATAVRSFIGICGNP